MKASNLKIELIPKCYLHIPARLAYGPSDAAVESVRAFYASVFAGHMPAQLANLAQEVLVVMGFALPHMLIRLCREGQRGKSLHNKNAEEYNQGATPLNESQLLLLRGRVQRASVRARGCALAGCPRVWARIGTGGSYQATG